MHCRADSRRGGVGVDVVAVALVVGRYRRDNGHELVLGEYLQQLAVYLGYLADIAEIAVERFRLDKL